MEFNNIRKENKERGTILEPRSGIYVQGVCLSGTEWGEKEETVRFLHSLALISLASQIRTL